jgi:hypothetical protein
VHCFHFGPQRQTVPHVRLVGNDRQKKACPLQPLQTAGGIRIKPEILEPPRGVATLIAELWNNDHPVPIEKNGRPQPTGLAYHFVCLRCKAG